MRTLPPNPITDKDIALLNKPYKPRKQPEGMIVKACIQWLFAHGCYVWRNNSGGFRDKRNRTVRFGHKGSADIIGVTASGQFISVECKTAIGRLRPEQKLFRDRIQEKAGIFILARSTDDLEARKREIMA